MDKIKLIKTNVAREDSIIVKEILVGYSKLDKKNKIALKDFVDFKYKPSSKARIWAKKVFNDLNDVNAKIVMYEIDSILK